MNRAGTILIAPPRKVSEPWTKSVIFLHEDHKGGSVGIILNKKSKISVKDLTAPLGVHWPTNEMIYMGGPVANHALCLLHTPEAQFENTMRINRRFCISSSQDMLNKMAEMQRPKYWRMFVGLSAWAPDQLESEIAGSGPWQGQQTWLTATADTSLIFGSDGQAQWHKAIELCTQQSVESWL